jgi:hypothetical protein
VRSFDRNGVRTTVQLLGTIVEEISKGGYGLPAFQRGYVWSDQQVIDLADSLIRGLPIGPILGWHRRSSAGIRPLDGGGIELQCVDHPVLLVDGQQRLSAMVRLFHADSERFCMNVEDGSWRTCDEPPALPEVLGRDILGCSVYVLRRLFGEAWDFDDPRAVALVKASDRLRYYQMVTMMIDADCSAAYVTEAFVRLARHGTPIAAADVERALRMLDDKEEK